MKKFPTPKEPFSRIENLEVKTFQMNYARGKKLSIFSCMFFFSFRLLGFIFLPMDSIIDHRLPD
jgi:hypothetical protein